VPTLTLRFAQAHTQAAAVAAPACAPTYCSTWRATGIVLLQVRLYQVVLCLADISLGDADISLGGDNAVSAHQLLYLLGLIVAANGCIMLAVIYPSHAAVIVVGYLMSMFLCAIWVSHKFKLSSKEMFALKVGYSTGTASPGRIRDLSTRAPSRTGVDDALCCSPPAQEKSKHPTANRDILFGT
jgi:hypothetical protein